MIIGFEERLRHSFLSTVNSMIITLHFLDVVVGRLPKWIKALNKILKALSILQMVCNGFTMRLKRLLGSPFKEFFGQG
jgi:uncharacterized protein involved in cysteine biosynthesis